MKWSGIPSLASLRAFEATARAGSYSGAARELNVTHAAIAQHVRALEDFFSTELLFREGRGMALTDAGSRLAVSLADGFGAIADGVQALHDATAARPLRVSVTPSFGENWLMPRLGAFWAAHPEIEVEIKPTARLVDLRRDDVDIAIRYGKGDWTGVEVQPLVAVRNVVVGAPALLGTDRPSTPTEMARYRWILERHVREAYFIVERLGLSLDEISHSVVDTNALAVSAIRSGLGLGVQSAALVGREIEAGQLIALTEPVADDIGYFMVTLKGRETPGLRRFMAWMRKAAG